MKLTSKKLINDLKTEKIRISLYVDKKLYKEFQKSCKDVSASRVVEALMKQFIEE
jgi:hypothetical protein